MTYTYYSMETRKQNHEGLRLKEFRITKGISQKEMAELLECSQPNLSKIERGELGISSTLRELILKEFQDLNPNWLFTGSGEMTMEVYDQNFISDVVMEKPVKYERVHKYFEKFEKLINEGKVPNNVIASIFSDMRRILKFQEETLQLLKESNEILLKSFEENTKILKDLRAK